MAEEKKFLKNELDAYESGARTGIREPGGEWEDITAEMMADVRLDLAGIETRIQFARAA